MTIEDKLIAKSGPDESIKVVQVKAGIRTVDRIMNGISMNLSPNLMIILVNEPYRDMNYPLLYTDESQQFLEQLKPGDKFVHVEQDGKTVFLYGPLKEESLYIPR